MDAEPCRQRPRPALQSTATEGECGPDSHCGSIRGLTRLCLCGKDHQQLEEEAKELAEKISSIVRRAKHLASTHFDSNRILQETDTYLTL